MVLLHGRREFIEKYNEVISELNGRGFDVYTKDWRGQGLSGRLLSNRHKGYVRSYEDYLEDLDRFIQQIVSPQAVFPRLILAHSMGAHLALRYLHDHPGMFEKAVFSAPMIDIASSALTRRLVKTFAWLCVTAGLKRAYVPGFGDFDSTDRKFDGNRLTSDPQRFQDELDAIDANPDLALGGPTFGWLKASLESIDVLVGDGYPEAIQTPILIVAAGNDRVVSGPAQKRMCRRLPAGCLHLVPGARHEILKENDQIRSAFWQAFDHFIR